MAYDFEAFQKFGKEQFEAASAAMGEVAKGLQAIATEATDYSKKSFEDGSAAFEKVFAAKSLDKAIEIQTDYAKNAYETFVAQATKMSELYADMAKEAYKPFEKAAAKVAA